MSGRTRRPFKKQHKRIDSGKRAVAKEVDMGPALHLLDRPAFMRSPPSDSERTESVASDAYVLEAEEQVELEDTAGILLDMIEADGESLSSLQRNGLRYPREGGAGKRPRIAISQGHPNAKIEIETGSSVLSADGGADIDAADTLLELSQGGHIFTEGNTRLKSSADKYWVEGDTVAANIRNNVSSKQGPQSLSPMSTGPVAKRALSPRKQCLMEMCADRPDYRGSEDEDRRGFRRHGTPSMRQREIMEGRRGQACSKDGRV
ncbi:hypothetical protein LTR95_002452 [Oleoguttula sp. CCFEE 5521]